MDPTGLPAIYAAFAIVAVSPGPANVAVSDVAARTGRRGGLAFGLGLGVGLAAWGLMAATGLGVALQASARALAVLKVAGGLYLLWLALQALRSATACGPPDPSAPIAARDTDRRHVVRGLLLNLSNPKAVVAWMAALSVGLDGRGDGAGLAAALSGCIAIGFCNYAGHALAFSHPAVMRGHVRLRRWIDGTVAALFAAAGLTLLRAALARAPA